MASTLVNCTSSYDFEEPDPQMVELAKYAKQHIPEKHPKVRQTGAGGMKSGGKSPVKSGGKRDCILEGVGRGAMEVPVKGCPCFCLHASHLLG